MSKIKQAQELLENIGIEFYSDQLHQIGQALKVEQALSGQQEPKTAYRIDSSIMAKPVVETVYP